MDISISQVDRKTYCYHCGLICPNTNIYLDNKFFCCYGCKTVYQLLSDNGMCNYYNLNMHPGISKKNTKSQKFAILDDPDVQKHLIRFSNKTHTQVSFVLPQIHCSSCIYLLENLSKIEPNIIHTRVDFLAKEIVITFNKLNYSLRQCAELLNTIGYKPQLSLNSLNTKKTINDNKPLISKLGVAGFAFGNIMLLSLPEYLSANVDTFILIAFKCFIVVLSLPVFFYSATEFFSPALTSLKKRVLNIDLPISLAITVTFIKSIYDILTSSSPGYLDSMTGIVFFMLIGRYVQNRTYKKLSFERDYSSYFPIAIDIIKKGKEHQIPLTKLKVDDKIIIKNNEIIPADSILLTPLATIDYSFVTGESIPIEAKAGDIIYAGGKQLGNSIILQVLKEVSSSYLTQLWNRQNNTSSHKNTLVGKLSQNFTLILFVIIVIAATYWAFVDTSKIFNVITTSLIIACPCALLLSSNFTNGTTINIFSKNSAYFKNHEAIEQLATANAIVFDKTGTLTDTKNFIVKYIGNPLSKKEKEYVAMLAQQSMHPLSRAISRFILDNSIINTNNTLKHLVEIPSRGLSAIIDNHNIKLGSKELVGNVKIGSTFINNGVYSASFLSVDDVYKGFFLVKSSHRSGIKTMVSSLSNHFKLAVLSGDNDKEKEALKTFFGVNSELKFYQKPEDKLKYIEQLQEQGYRTIMVGDGLNDAGALMQSNVGITVTDNINNFTPACDIIIDANQLKYLNKFIKLAKYNRNIIKIAFAFSITYNIIGLYFSLQGLLHPVIAAILMPSSSLTIIIISYLITKLSALTLKLKI